MSRNRKRLLGALVALSVCAVSIAVVARPRKGPSYNVVLISMDTTRRDHLSFYDYFRDTSPRMAALAADGVIFDQAIGAHTNTAPAHASMLTGLYPSDHGILRNGGRLNEDVRTLGEILRDRGYETGAFVSGWTLNDHTGLNRGFDTYNQRMVRLGRRPASLTLRPALAWLRERAESEDEFFLFFHLFDPHYPYDPPDEYAERFLEGRELSTRVHPQAPGPRSEWRVSDDGMAEQVLRYDAEIAYADHQLGLLIDHMKDLGIYESTIFVFTSDHGETHYERDWVFDHGGRAYDEQVRIPLFVRLPGNRHGGTRVQTQASQIDVLPTVLDALGAPLENPVAGRSLLPLMAEESEEDLRRPLFAHSRPEPARVPEIAAPITRHGLVSLVRLPKVKLIEYPLEGGGWYRQLFDLEEDPEELRNIADEQPELAAELHEQLIEFRRATGSEDLGAPAELEPEVEEALRALGYVE